MLLFAPLFKLTLTPEPLRAALVQVLSTVLTTLDEEIPLQILHFSFPWIDKNKTNARAASCYTSGTGVLPRETDYDLNRWKLLGLISAT